MFVRDYSVVLIRLTMLQNIQTGGGFKAVIGGTYTGKTLLSDYQLHLARAWSRLWHKKSNMGVDLVWFEAYLLIPLNVRLKKELFKVRRWNRPDLTILE